MGLWQRRTSTGNKTIIWQDGLLSVCFFAASLILRLAFLQDVFVPPYFDSVEHYRIIKGFITGLETLTLPTLTSTYYHLGFHFFASLLALGLRADPIDVILVLGQVILAAIPVPAYFLIRQETASAGAAFFAMLLAGFGWYMPGFAVNWGKYPALAGLLALGIVLGIAYGFMQGKRDRLSPISITLLLFGILFVTFFHTRALVITAISIASWFIASRMRASRLFLAFLLAANAVLMLLIQAEPHLRLALDPYLNAGLCVTLIVFALSPFALLHFQRGFYFSTLFVAGILVALFIPAGLRSPGLENQTLLDRPFVEMVLYLPLSLLGGYGLAGLLRSINGIRALPKRASIYSRTFMVVLLLGFTGLLVEKYDFSPAECCKFVSYDDTIALDWLDKNLPADARFLVAGTALNVLAAGPSPGLAGTDAGIWIPNLTGREIRLVSFDTDFRSENTLREMCQMQIEYMYVGSTAQTFNRAQFSERTKWYKRILFLPNVQLYQVTGCP